MQGHLFLIGFMGAGKTSLGKTVSKMLGIPYLDTDNLIEDAEGMTVSEIFARKGEAYFRQKETALLGDLSKREGSYVLSVGGGLPLREENRPLLKKLGQVIYIRTSPKILAGRLESDTKRPVLKQGEGTILEKVERILGEREPKYVDAADIIIENDGRSFFNTAKKIINIYRKGGEYNDQS